MELTDRELAIRWWGRRTTEEKQELVKQAQIPRENIDSFTGREIEWIWRNQPYKKK